jgi:predicted nucleic acid-binding protein
LICGVDANVLIYSAIQSMPEHRRVLSFFERRVLTGEITCAVTFPVLLEFIHITTDSRRFKPPLTLEESTEIVEEYWHSIDWRQLIPQPGTGSRALQMLRRYSLGRKRLLDTYLVATLLDNGVTALITCDRNDFKVFDDLETINPLQRSAAR